MRNRMNLLKGIFLVFAVQMICLLFGKDAFAYSGVVMESSPESDFEFADCYVDQNGERSEDGATLLKYLGKEKKVVVPYEIEGKEVRAVFMEAFSGNQFIEEVYLPDSVEGMGEEVFYDCPNLKKVDLGSMRYAFDRRGMERILVLCPSLESVEMSDRADFDLEDKEGCRNIFGDGKVDSLKYIYIGDSMGKVYLPFFYGKNLEYIEIGKNNQHYRSVDGIVYSKDMKTLLVCGIAYRNEVYEIPDGVEKIDRIAFELCHNPKSLKVPASVKDLSEYLSFVKTMEVREGSYGEWYARRHGISIVYYGNPVSEEEKINISSYKAELSTSKYIYNGSERKPKVTIEGLKEGVDYRVTYKNNVNAGTAIAVIDGIHCCTGGIIRSFMIDRGTGKITVKSSDIVKTSGAGAFHVGAQSNGGVLSYKSSHPKVARVTNNGTVTLPKNAVGRATITITAAATNNCKSASKKITITVNPKGTVLSKITAGKKCFTVKWKKQPSLTTGYQIQYSADKNFKKGVKSITVSRNKTVSKKISRLQSKKKYYVRIRTYKTVRINGKQTKLYSAWSKARTVITRK